MPGLDHVVDVANAAATVAIKNGALEVRLPRSGDEPPPPTRPIALCDIAAVILSHPGAAITRAALAELASAGVPVVVAGGVEEGFMPVAMSLPLHGHSTQQEKFEVQAAASLPTKKRCWQQIIRAKIMGQGKLLAALRGSDFGLLARADAVRSGDPDNLEGQAARTYWPALFGDDFLRRPDGSAPNHLLNYGYAVMRAFVARSITAAGLHPGLGLQHHNKYNSYVLADDLMEPFRPHVDEEVVMLCDQFGPDVELRPEVKARLIAVPNKRLEFMGEARTIGEVAQRLAWSLAQVFEGSREKLALP